LDVDYRPNYGELNGATGMGKRRTGSCKSTGTRIRTGCSKRWRPGRRSAGRRRNRRRPGRRPPRRTSARKTQTAVGWWLGDDFELAVLTASLDMFIVSVNCSGLAEESIGVVVGVVVSDPRRLRAVFIPVRCGRPETFASAERREPDPGPRRTDKLEDRNRKKPDVPHGIIYRPVRICSRVHISTTPRPTHTRRCANKNTTRVCQ